MDKKKLAQKAVEAKKFSYAPYSNFHVGAALLTDDEKIFTGTNIENSSYGLTMCAERVAVFKAVSGGKRKFKAIAVTTDLEEFCPPCGACRQVLNDLCGKNLEVILVNSKMEMKTFKMENLLPHSFGDDLLK